MNDALSKLIEDFERDVTSGDFDVSVATKALAALKCLDELPLPVDHPNGLDTQGEMFRKTINRAIAEASLPRWICSLQKRSSAR